ncbi:type II toxin-antitoxin system prevent-host-death family antitoxin [Rhabdaerophilum sp. SD176]|uniref:type II toxin-antitoxin system Phd/YefM family antitoxin n=1 Tax=Rhabdaerophilum sp. SD176 TaxID=2983548 RepID=UPI0024DFC097|nr:type II toxin-antitoxin system prevent-host-death family antitoxin [Rhabdaerophilum sp. SD176]
MKTLNLRDAKATFSAVVEAATQGEPTVVTKHGRPAAMIVPIEEGRRIFPDTKPSFADLLLSMPHELQIERDQTPMREVDL